MLSRKPQSKKKSTGGPSTVIPLDSSLTSIEWLPNMQIGENTSATTVMNNANTTTNNQNNLNHHQCINTNKQSLPVTNTVQHKLEATEIEMPSTTVHENGYTKPPYSYVTLIRQAILSTQAQRMTLNEIYQWIVETYPYFRTAPPKWKNSIRHNLSLNKCFKRLQRSTNDPGKGSYWAVDESSDHSNQLTNARKRKFDEIQTTLPALPASPAGLIQQNAGFYTNNNPMIGGGGIGSVGGQSSSTDESDSTVSLANQAHLMQWVDLNFDLTASFRRFREQVLDQPQTTWVNGSDTTTTTQASSSIHWAHDLFPNGDHGFFESLKLASSGEIDWSEIDVKPYCEFLDGFRTNTSFQNQDRDQLLNLASSLSSFFEHTGITNLVQSRIANNEQYSVNRSAIISNRPAVDPLINSNPLPTVLEDEPAFDWDSIT